MLYIKLDKEGSNSFGDKELVLSVRDSRIEEGDNTVKVFDFSAVEGEHHQRKTFKEALIEVKHWIDKNEKNYK